MRNVAGDGWLLEVRNVCKAFPGVVALDDVSVRLGRGTVHALSGENGAGKSTLMKIIAGVYAPDAGELLLNGRDLRLGSPRDALNFGIAMIHQELNLMPHMSVAENIWIRREPINALGLISHRELKRRTRALLERLRIDIDPEAEVRTLPVAARQMVEIARALSYESQLLIMDEPTSALGERDADHLFAIIRELKAQGKGILYITHRLEELFEIADELSVLRDGRYVGGGTPATLTREAIVRMMVGRELPPAAPVGEAQRGAVLLAARHLTLERHFRDVSFELHAGEILGIAGLVGAGRTSLAEALFGLTGVSSGRLSIGDREVKVDSPQSAISHGLAFVTEDRKESGCFLTLSVLGNLEISVLHGDFVRFGFVRTRAVSEACTAMCALLRVKTPDLHEPIGNLSGGNQQKVLIGRCLLTRPKILILDEPTRGVDVAAKAEIHQLISRLVGEGTAVLLISSALPEMVAASLAQSSDAARAVYPSLTDMPVLVPVLAGLAGGAAAGLLNGTLIAWTSIPPFIATLGVMVTARGLAKWYTHGEPVSMLTDRYADIGGGALPVMIFLATALIFHIALRYTRYGKLTYAIGANPQAARVAGIPVTRHLIAVYTIAGTLSGLAGIVTSARAVSGQAGMGTMYELDAIAAAVIGGASLAGGVGRITGTVIGTMILGVVTSGFTFLRIDAYYQEIVKGAIIVVAVIADQYRQRA